MGKGTCSSQIGHGAPICLRELRQCHPALCRRSGAHCNQWVHAWIFHRCGQTRILVEEAMRVSDCRSSLRDNAVLAYQMIYIYQEQRLTLAPIHSLCGITDWCHAHNKVNRRPTQPAGTAIKQCRAMKRCNRILRYGLTAFQNLFSTCWNWPNVLLSCFINSCNRFCSMGDPGATAVSFSTSAACRRCRAA